MYMLLLTHATTDEDRQSRMRHVRFTASVITNPHSSTRGRQVCEVEATVGTLEDLFSEEARQ